MDTEAWSGQVAFTGCLPHLQGNVTVERAALAVHLVQEARRLYPAIQFHFNTAIQVLTWTPAKADDGESAGETMGMRESICRVFRPDRVFRPGSRNSRLAQ